MRIAILLDAVLPASLYGGTERQVYWLAREFIRRGHAVTVIAMPGSFVPGARMIEAKSSAEAFAAIPPDVDVVNTHSGEPPKQMMKPCLITCHGNQGAPTAGNWSFVSRDHAERHGRRTFVYNGLPVDEHYFCATKSDRYLFFSRINRAGKNVTKVLDLARRHDLAVDVAGGSRWDLLTRRQVRQEGAFWTSFSSRFQFHGMVGGWKKARLFAEAKALLFPIRWEEPFGLVVIEALLAGTPVITSPFGAMPELIDPEVGFICRSDSDYTAAIATCDEINPHRCRDFAASHFSIERTADGYLSLYERILAGEVLP